MVRLPLEDPRECGIVAEWEAVLENTSRQGGRVQRVLARVIPSTVLIGVVVWTLVGPNGLRDLYTLSEHANEARDRWANLEKANTRLLLDLQRLEQDPINLERLAADQLGLVRPGTTLYAFDERDGAATIVPSTTATVPVVAPLAPVVPVVHGAAPAKPEGPPAPEPAD